MSRSLPLAAAVLATGMLGLSGAAVAAGPDWSAVPATEIPLIYPGQSSLEWMVNAEHKAGATGVRDGKPCLECHADEEADIGAVIAKGEKLEPTPIPGKAGVLPLTFQAAFDAENLYMRASWPSAEAGQYHDYIMYKDGQWVNYGNQRTHAKVVSGEEPAVYEDRFSIMVADPAKVPEFGNLGCWMTCHGDMRYMPGHPTRDDVEAHPLLGKDGQKRSDIRKYISATRTGAGGWADTRSADEIAALRKDGAFLDLMQWRGHRSNPVDAADDGYVLEYRKSDKGKGPFGNNWDNDTKAPKFMFDPAKNGGKPGLSMADVKNPDGSYFLGDDNKVAYDPNAGWKDGDLLFRRVMTANMEGSAGDNNQVKGEWKDGRWTVTWTRKLDTGNADDDVALKPGTAYPIGFAVHDDHVTARWHYVSFPITLGLGAEGTINAVALK